jgi:hypothetical protein
MTEITGNIVPCDPSVINRLMIKTNRKPGYLIDPVAFFVALIAGPLLVTAMSFWFLLIPVFALVMGGPIYLIIGTPLLLIYLRYNQPNVGGIAFMALVAVLALFPITSVFSWILGDLGLLQGSVFFLGFGLLFGPLWAVAFSKIYLRMRRDFYAIPRPI